MGWDRFPCRVAHLLQETKFCGAPSPSSSSLLLPSFCQKGWDGGLTPRLSGASRGSPRSHTRSATWVLCVLGTFSNL